MSLYVNALFLCMVAGLFLAPQHLWAQKVKGVTAVRQALSSSVDRSLAKVMKKPDIRLSVARMEDRGIFIKYPPQQRPHSTAFLFKTTYQGRPEVWAATAGHTAQLGEELILTFHDGQKEIYVKGSLVQNGPALLSDAALIKLEEPIPEELQPFSLATAINPQEPLTTWGYASHNLYRIDNLTFEKDNTRFIRTDFPESQKKRSGLCGGPLLNPQGEVLGIHCGTSLEDKAYASNINIIPYLLQAYYEGSAEIPLVAKQIIFGSIQINERILNIQCTSETDKLLNHEEVYDQLPQSLIMSLYSDPEVRYVRFVLGSYLQDKPTYRVLVYDKQTHKHWFEPLSHKLGF